MSNEVKKKNITAKKVFKVILRVLSVLLLAFLCLLTYFVPKMSFYTEKRANFYSEKIFPKVAYIGNSLFNVSQTSISELVVVVGSITLLISVVTVLVLLIVKIFKGGFFKFLYKVTAVSLTIVFVLSLIFQLMHGLNYRRTSVEDALNLVGGKHSIEEILPVFYWARDEMVAARSKLGKDYNGVVHMSTGFDESVYYANTLVNSAASYFDLDISENYVRAKPVSLSHLWSYTNILGMYNPIFGEANVNVDCMLPQISAVTLVHEILHAKGYARESDAELLAVLSCCMADRSDFRYAGFLELYTDLYFVLYNAGVKFPFDEGARLDSMAYQAYNDSLLSNKFTEVVADVSESTNDTYLKSNEQEGGTDTYIINNNYYVEFYYNYVSASVNND